MKVLLYQLRSCPTSTRTQLCRISETCSQLPLHFRFFNITSFLDHFRCFKMADEDVILWHCDVAIAALSIFADLFFIWILYFSSTRYPRPSDDGSWNQYRPQHECCNHCVDDDVAQCCCGWKCRKLNFSSTECGCCYPLELCIPRYPQSLFSYFDRQSIESNSTRYSQLSEQQDDDDDEEKAVSVELETLRDDTPDPDHEHNDDAVELLTASRMEMKATGFRILDDVAGSGRCCCSGCLSMFFKIWFLFSGILSFVICLVFSFTVFFEFIIKSLTLQNGQFIGILVAILVITQLLVCLLSHSLKAVWLMTYNICDSNRLLIVEWWRFWHILWNIVIAVIYLLSVDPDALDEAHIAESIARFMVIQGLCWMFTYFAMVIICSFGLILNVIDCAQCTRNQQMDCLVNALNPYRWRWIKRNALCRHNRDAQNVLIFEHQQSNRYKLSVIDWLTGYKRNEFGTDQRRKWCLYLKCGFTAILILCGFSFVIAGYVMGTHWEWMVFSGWALLFYYILLLITRDGVDAVIFRVWNGWSYKVIYHSMKEIATKHSEHYFYDQLAQGVNEQRSKVIILRYVDVWSMYRDDQQSGSCALCCCSRNCRCCCCCLTAENEQNGDNADHSDDGKESESVWFMMSMQQFNHLNAQIWATIGILLIPFLLVICARSLIADARSATKVYDADVAHWNWSTEALGKNQYPFCHSAEVNQYLNAFDLIWLSQSAWYFEDSEKLQNSFRMWFGDNDTETGWKYNDSMIQFVTNGYEPTAYHIENTKHHIDLVVIRGSYTLADWIQDANLWCEAVVIQLASLGRMSTDMTRYLLR